MSDATVRATPTRDFTDAGTQRRFTAGEPCDLTTGEFTNFEAAGLVTPVPDNAGPADAGEPSTKTRTR